MTIHWCGTGLSAIPGLRRLLQAGHDVQVWNRTVDKAQAAVGDLTDRITAFDLDTLTDQLEAGDVVVSMLPGDWHVPLAKACLFADAHFVSSSYISPEMAALDADAKKNGLCFVNEIGLDPGIDHLMAHHLVEDLRAAKVVTPDSEVSFLSYCGGIPKHPNPFRYKFSWSPLGVLKALRSPSRSVQGGQVRDVNRPWDAIDSYTAPLPKAESFEVYPNRDSLPFINQYDFDHDWPIRDFVRGTLRLNGWKDAWAEVFEEVERLASEPAETAEARLKEMSDGFWSENAYEEGEPDRVVLCVDLKVSQGKNAFWHKTYVMDAWGDANGSAMARLVSIPVSLAIESVLAGELPPGVTPAPSAPALVNRYLAEVETLAQHLAVVDHTS